MEDELRFPARDENGGSGDSLDPQLVALLRGAYAPPQESAFYWQMLQQRIVARARSARTGGDNGFWTVLYRWAYPGLAAAAAVLLTLGLINARVAATADTAVAVEEISPVSTPEEPLISEMLFASDDASSREATFRFVLSR